MLDFLLIGQGICGTFLSWYLKKAGYSCIVIDQPQPTSASQVAAGIINPVTGRRIVKTWLIDEVLPFAQNAYDALANTIGGPLIEQKNIIDFFPTPQMKIAFEKRYAADTQYLAAPVNENDQRNAFHYDFGYGIINPCYLVSLPTLLPAYRQWLQQQNCLQEELFNPAGLQVFPDHVQYGSIIASAIIFCDGIASATHPWFSNLPFAPNKGEVLLVQIKDLPPTHIFKRGINLVPWKDDIFWVGSSYEWEFEHDQPTTIFRERTLAALQQWIRLPFRLLDHKAAVRPATLERRPFVGFHPLHPTVGIFNGMGTKGCSLAPYFADQLTKHLLHKTPIAPEANVQRFKRVLSRGL
jgi:glycine/D-amino acid oxidase-like deaminating enzyme